MAQKGNRKKGVFGSEPVLPKVISKEETLNDNVSSELLTESMKKALHVASGKKSKQKSTEPLVKEKLDTDAVVVEGPAKSWETCRADHNNPAVEDLNIKQGSNMHVDGIPSSEDAESRYGQSLNGLRMDGAAQNLQLSGAMVVEHLRAVALSISKASRRSLERLMPLLIGLSTKTQDAFRCVRRKIELAYPIVFGWIMHFGNIMLVLFVVWLDCALRGAESFLRMGTASFFSVIWCSVFSIIAMIGMLKFLLFLVMAAVIGLFIGITISLLLIAISGVVLLWFYGSFWTSLLAIFPGGLAFLLRHEHLALFIMTLYSVYCAWAYVGGLGVILALNLSFISSDALIYFVSNRMSEPRGQPGFFSGEPMHASSAENDDGISEDRSTGMPSTSGSESEMTSEDEVTRLLNCIDHYSALGISRFENVDVSILKREYKKKAMLVHPDKNMGNEKAAEAFKKLQNAYEVLLDSFKRKAYDDELRREELINYIRRFQNAPQKSRRHGFFSSAFSRTEANNEDIPGESRRIACRKCGNFHIWMHTKKSKSKARWCQECKDYHPAKDGDGWVEQASQPFLFGILQKVDVPAAFVCAESRIYDATEWYICQGMRCPANTHKPSFHVNTNVTSKHNNGRGTSSGQRGGVPKPNMEETMTEEEFFEWLQNAVQAGVFENFPGSTSESPSAQAENTPKSSGCNSGSANKRKKRGKKQR